MDKLNHFNWPKWLPQTHHDINEVLENFEDNLKDLRGKVCLVAGGPPCQGFSQAGQRNESDIRNKLVDSYIKFVSLVKPKLIFFENVKGFTLEFKKNSEKGKRYSDYVLSELDKQGYYVYGKLINFGNYGIPQKRTRYILVGMRKNLRGASRPKIETFFTLLESNKFSFLDHKGLVAAPTIQDAISDLTQGKLVDTPDRRGFKSSKYKKATSSLQKHLRKDVRYSIPNSHSFAKHTMKVQERLRFILSLNLDGKNMSDTLKKQLGITKQVLVPLKPELQAPTITSHPDDLIHYSEPRILTVREYARIQSFPDDFEFVGKYTTGGILRKVETPRYTQIGNAVPPLFGEQSGLILREIL